MLCGFMTFPSTSSSGGYGRIREIFCLIGMRDEISPLKVNLFLCLPANEEEVWSNKESNKYGSFNQFYKRHYPCHQRVARCFCE